MKTIKCQISRWHMGFLFIYKLIENHHKKLFFKSQENELHLQRCTSQLSKDDGTFYHRLPTIRVDLPVLKSRKSLDSTLARSFINKRRSFNCSSSVRASPLTFPETRQPIPILRKMLFQSVTQAAGNKRSECSYDNLVISTDTLPLTYGRSLQSHLSDRCSNYTE